MLDVLQDQWARMSHGDRVLVQAGVYRNDRQVRVKHVVHGIDKWDPRCEIEVRPLQMQQVEMVDVDMNGRC